MTDTERIDLDELDVAEEDADQSEPSRGDWLWKDDPAGEAADPSEQAEASAPSTAGDSGSDLIQPSADSTAQRDGDEKAVADAKSAESGDTEGPEPADPGATESETATEDSDESATKTADAIPRVPRQNDDRPVGIPAERGGAGAGAAQENAKSEAAAESETAASDTGPAEGEPPEPRPMSTADYHDADVDDMTMALTFNAVQQLADPALAIAEARQWADWIGIVGDVPAHQINKFQRDHRIDADFFNGSGTDPGERLASIDHNSMFFAERLAVVGVAGEDEPIAQAADWEFVSLSEAAEKADWELDSE